MTKAKKMPLPRLGLSLANVDAEARDIDWREMGDGEGYGGGYEVKLPAPTYGDWAEYGDCPADVARIAARSPNRPLPDGRREAFEDTTAYYEWKDGFEPMMNYAWPGRPRLRTERGRGGRFGGTICRSLQPGAAGRQ